MLQLKETSKYDLNFAKEILIRSGLRIEDKTISSLKTNPPGIKLLGVIDYLTKVHKYFWKKNS